MKKFPLKIKRKMMKKIFLIYLQQGREIKPKEKAVLDLILTGEAKESEKYIVLHYLGIQKV